jgi:hypothetical protein
VKWPLPLGYEIHHRPLAAARLWQARLSVRVDIHHVRKLSTPVLTVDGYIPVTTFGAREKQYFVRGVD